MTCLIVQKKELIVNSYVTSYNFFIRMTHESLFESVFNKIRDIFLTHKKTLNKQMRRCKMPFFECFLKEYLIGVIENIINKKHEKH